jgi:hypothetical protein
MRDGNCAAVVAPAPRVRSRVFLTVTMARRTVSNRRGISENPDLRRFLPNLTLAMKDTYCLYVSY